MEKRTKKRNLKRWGAILLTLGLSSGIGFTAQAGGWERLSNTSPWKGSFVRSDGRTITITDADPDLLFISMVSSQELGMACFAPGIYRSFYVNENTENEKWEFSVYTSMSWEEWTLHGPSDKREVGRVDYTYMDLYDNPIYTKEDMILYNTMSGETCYLFSLGTNREDQFVREKISRTVPYFRTMRLISVCIGIQTFIICPSVLQLPQRSSLPSSQDLHQSRNERIS